MKYYCKNCGTEFRFRDNIWNDDNCPVCGNDDPDYELFYIPDFETPAQYEKRTGKPFPNNGLVFTLIYGLGGSYWSYDEYGRYREEVGDEYNDSEVVIADPPVPPPDDWRPEEGATA